MSPARKLSRLSEARLPLGSPEALVIEGQLLFLCKALGPSPLLSTTEGFVPFTGAAFLSRSIHQVGNHQSPSPVDSGS